MEPFIYHLRKIVRINRQILNDLHRDEATASSLREAFDEREVHTQKMGDLIADVDKDSLSDEQSAAVKTLFEQFGSQSKTIQDALDQIIDSARDKLGEAVRQRKAQDSYQALK